MIFHCQTSGLRVFY